ncbi:MAG: SAF domain-containing protein [Candidatus Cohnella colombiensis]|uniref:SAF domain-containing protein n=1 Tax=Candidatus Cohnella colombiensis TaxID=3121368 RepID=A0AA95JDP0_9BACL|nr:MAG: SAF domain-containing protein [Cohnella sp.]
MLAFFFCLIMNNRGDEVNRRRQFTISLTAAVLAGVLVYGVYLLQLRQLQQEEMIEVWVPKQFIATGTMITSEHLRTMFIPRSVVTIEMVTDVAEVVGLEAAAPLGEGEPLLLWKLDKYRLLPNREQSTFQIPKEYVKSISNGIRAGDQVLVFVSDKDALSKRLFSEAIVVAAVKTAANLEIDNPKNPNLLNMVNDNEEGMYASRRDANGTIDVINLNLTESQWLELDSICKAGTAKLVISFQASTSEGEGRR